MAERRGGDVLGVLRADRPRPAQLNGSVAPFGSGIELGSLRVRLCRESRIGRRERLRRSATTFSQQRLDGTLGDVVLALTEVRVANLPGFVDEVLGGPVLIVVGVPGRHVGV